MNTKKKIILIILVIILLFLTYQLGYTDGMNNTLKNNVCFKPDIFKI